MPHHLIQRVHHILRQAKTTVDFGLTRSGPMNHTAKLVNISTTSTNLSFATGSDSVAASEMSPNAWILVLMQETRSPSGFASSRGLSSASVKTSYVSAKITASSPKSRSVISTSPNATSQLEPLTTPLIIQSIRVLKSDGACTHPYLTQFEMEIIQESYLHTSVPSLSVGA